MKKRGKGKKRRFRPNFRARRAEPGRAREKGEKGEEKRHSFFLYLLSSARYGAKRKEREKELPFASVVLDLYLEPVNPDTALIGGRSKEIKKEK